MREKGFTLLEVAVVLLLIGLFAMLALPRLPGIGDSDLQRAANRLSGTVKYLFNEAALTRREHRLVFNLDRQSFGARRLEESGELVDIAGTGRQRSLPGSVRFRDIRTAAGSHSTGEVAVSFYPAGWIEETVIHLADGRNRMLTLRLNSFTGATEVYEGYREF